MSVKVQLKHSAVKDKAPVATDLSAGELALNINDQSPAAYIKDSAGNIVKIAGAGAAGGVWKRNAEGTGAGAHVALSPNTAGDKVQISAGTEALPGLTPVGDPNTGIWAPAADTLAVSTNDKERLRVTSDGKLLVGTTTPDTTYRVGVAGSTPSVELKGTDVYQLALNRTNNSCFLAIASKQTASSGVTVGGITFNQWDGNNLLNAASIKGEVDGTPGVDNMPGRLVFSTTADGASAPTERMQIDSSGSVTIFGQTNQLVLNRSGHSNWNFGNFSGGLGLHQDLQDGNGPKLRLAISQESAPGFGIRFYNTSEVETLRVEEDGNVLNTNNSYGSLSDAKLKENIVDATSQWDDLKALKVRKYNFKAETSYSAHTQIGLIAQEVELVSPGLVSETPDTDEDGNDLGTVTKSVNYSVLYMKAVKALQEAMARIETLEAKVTALEAK